MATHFSRLLQALWDEFNIYNFEWIFSPCFNKNTQDVNSINDQSTSLKLDEFLKFFQSLLKRNDCQCHAPWFCEVSGSALSASCTEPVVAPVFLCNPGAGLK